MRKQYIKFLFDTLSPYGYILLKHTDQSIFDLSESSDIDILFLKKQYHLAAPTLAQHKTILKIDKSSKPSFTQWFIYFKDGSFLQVDFLHYFARKNLVYLSKELMIDERSLNHEGIYVMPSHYLLEHLVLFNFLNFAGIKSKYVHYFENLTSEEQLQALTAFNKKYKTEIKTIEEFGNFDNKIRQKIVTKISQTPDNKGFQKIKHSINYILDQMQETKTKKGITITFSGVDGAGKSTILAKTKELIEEKYRRKVVMLRHRPQILPILSSYKYGKEEAEKRAAETMPRTGGNKSSIGSIARFFYYYADYVLGQFYIWFKYLLRGYVVLYDRYYFDFIVDHRRSNININSAIPKALYAFIFKPSINFFLYAPAEVILKRKQELDAESITKLTTDYKGLFERLDKRSQKLYLPIENIHLEETMATIEKAFVERS